MALAADGIVEAVEDTTHGFLVGVQWHPEEDSTDIRPMAARRAAADDFRNHTTTQEDSQ